MKLAIPINYNGNLLFEVETKEYNAAILADTKKMIDSGNGYKAIQTFISGCVEKIGEISDKQIIKELVGKMPFQSSDLLMLQILFKNSQDDGIEGYYPCPRCGETKICENENGLDTRDHFSELDIEYTENTEFTYHLISPITLEADDDSLIVTELGFRYSTLNDCSGAVEKCGIKDTVRLQLNILSESLKTVNGMDIDKKWKNRYSLWMFEKMNNDLRNINDKMQEFGLKTKVKKNCLKCGKEFEISLNTANFFVSALS